MSLRRNTTLQSLLAAKEVLLLAKKGSRFSQKQVCQIRSKFVLNCYFLSFSETIFTQTIRDVPLYRWCIFFNIVKKKGGGQTNV